MNINEMKEGRQLWFRIDEKERGEIVRKWVPRQGTVLGTTKGKGLNLDTATLECDGERFEVKCVDCYADRKYMDRDIEWDKREDEFTEKVSNALDKYLDKAWDLAAGTIKGVVKGSVDNALPDGAVDTAKGMGRAMQLYGFQFRQNISTLTERFLGRTQEMCLTRLSDNLKERALHTDLSEYEPGKVFLEDKDLRSLSRDTGKGMAL